MKKPFQIVLLVFIFQFKVYGQSSWVAKNIETQNGNKWGFFNPKGKIQLEPVYDTVYFNFTNGLAGVGQIKQDSLRAGVINKKGKMVLEYNYSNVQPIGQYIAIENFQHFWGLLDANMDQVLPVQYKKLIDQDSVVVCQFFAKYEVYNLQNGSIYSVYADSIVLKGAHLSVSRNGNSIPIKQIDTSFLGKMPSQSNEVKHEDIHSETHFMPVEEDGHYGFRDTSGNIVISLQYEDAKSFSEGLAPVKIMGKWAYISPYEEFIIQPLFDQAWPFYKNSALVKIDGDFNFIDRKGTLRNKKGFTKVERLPTGNWKIWSQNDVGLADSLGSERIIPKYTSLHDWGNGYVCFLKHGLYGVLDYDQNIIVPGKYTRVFRQNQFVIGQVSSPKLIVKPIAKK